MRRRPGWRGAAARLPVLVVAPPARHGRRGPAARPGAANGGGPASARRARRRVRPAARPARAAEQDQGGRGRLRARRRARPGGRGGGRVLRRRPGRVHEHAAGWAAARGGERVGRTAAWVADGRRDLGAAEHAMVADVLYLQRARHLAAAPGPRRARRPRPARSGRAGRDAGRGGDDRSSARTRGWRVSTSRTPPISSAGNGWSPSWSPAVWPHRCWPWSARRAAGSRRWCGPGWCRQLRSGVLAGSDEWRIRLLRTGAADPAALDVDCGAVDGDGRRGDGDGDGDGGTSSSSWTSSRRRSPPGTRESRERAGRPAGRRDRPGRRAPARHPHGPRRLLRPLRPPPGARPPHRRQHPARRPDERRASCGRRSTNQPGSPGWTSRTGSPTRCWPTSAHEPGALPLLSTALLATWERRDGRMLRVAAYREAGGVAGALTRLADGVYDGLDADGRAAARRVFLRLATPGEGGDELRRRARRGPSWPAASRTRGGRAGRPGRAAAGHRRRRRGRGRARGAAAGMAQAAGLAGSRPRRPPGAPPPHRGRRRLGGGRTATRPTSTAAPASTPRRTGRSAHPGDANPLEQAFLAASAAAQERTLHARPAHRPPAAHAGHRAGRAARGRVGQPPAWRSCSAARPTARRGWPAPPPGRRRPAGWRRWPPASAPTRSTWRCCSASRGLPARSRPGRPKAAWRPRSPAPPPTSTGSSGSTRPACCRSCTRR